MSGPPSEHNSISRFVATGGLITGTAAGVCDGWPEVAAWVGNEASYVAATCDWVGSVLGIYLMLDGRGTGRKILGAFVAVAAMAAIMSHFVPVENQLMAGMVQVARLGGSGFGGALTGWALVKGYRKVLHLHR